MKKVTQDLYYIDENIKHVIENYITKKQLNSMISLSIKKGTPVTWNKYHKAYVTDVFGQLVDPKFVK